MSKSLRSGTKISNTKSSVAKPTGPSGLRAGRLIEYKGEYGKVISLATTVKAKISIGGKELMVNRSDLKFASAASKKANASKKAVEKSNVDLPIKKTAARARINKKKGVGKLEETIPDSLPEKIKAPVTIKKVPAKKTVAKEVPKKVLKKPIQPKGLKVVYEEKISGKKVVSKKNEKLPRATSFKGTYKILRPEYVALAFTDIYSDKSTLEKLIKTLNLYNIQFSFANIAEGTNIDDHEEFQKQNNVITERNQQIKRSILDFADPEKSGMATPHLENDMLVFKVSGAKDFWLLKLLETVRDKLAIDNIETMITMSIEDDGPSDSIVQNILIIGFA